MLIFAIGDIHGMHGLFLEALSRIEARADGKEYKIVYLGDMIDRGPESRAVVSLIKERVEKDPFHNIAIRGNHEQMAINYYFAPDSDMYAHSWILPGNGGEQTVSSYLGDNETLKIHLEWFKQLPVIYVTENHIFVHAGMKPGTPIEEQEESSLLWIRNWWKEDHDFGKHVVYGHTPWKEPHLLINSSGLDTGACYGNKLSIGIFDEFRKSGPIEVMQVSADDCVPQTAESG
jgi:Calcineurin-like phosphoesterase